MATVTRKVLEVLGETLVASEPGEGLPGYPRRACHLNALQCGADDQARGDLHRISEDLAVSQAQLALLPAPGSFRGDGAADAHPKGRSRVPSKSPAPLAASS